MSYHLPEKYESCASRKELMMLYSLCAPWLVIPHHQEIAKKILLLRREGDNALILFPDNLQKEL